MRIPGLRRMQAQCTASCVKTSAFMRGLWWWWWVGGWMLVVVVGGGWDSVSQAVPLYMPGPNPPSRPCPRLPALCADPAAGG